MTPSEETYSTAHESSAWMRVGEIGVVDGVGQCWRLSYDHCNHAQEFAREGLEDPGRLQLFIQRNFSACLSCRLETDRTYAAMPNGTPPAMAREPAENE